MRISEGWMEMSDFYEGLMLTSISDDDIHKINAYQRMISAGIATDKSRLLRDQSTENISMKQVVQILNLRLQEVREIQEWLSRDEEGD
jgi:hypothetical protein